MGIHRQKLYLLLPILGSIDPASGIPDSGGSRITTKHRVFFALALTAVFLVGHQTITQGSGLRMNKVSTAVDLVDLNRDVSKAQVC